MSKTPRTSSKGVSRRTVLRGIGAAVCLPFLESLRPMSAWASAPPATVRAAYLYIPNGVAEGSWYPEEVADGGKLLRLNKWMKALDPFKQDLIIPEKIFTPRGNGHGAGTATWLTGGGYNGKDIDAGGISVDQLIATRFGHKTVLPSLELSTRGEGYFSNDLPRNSISWTASGQPAAREEHPRVIFDRMFHRAKDGGVERSVIDLVQVQAKRLRARLGRGDERKVDEYLEAVRSVERRLEFSEKQSTRASADKALTDTLERPRAGIPIDHKEYVRLLLDMIVLAFWSDATRVATFMLDHGQSNRYFSFIDGVQGTWHALSHWRDISGRTEDDDGKTSWKTRDEKRDMYSAVSAWHTEQVAYLLGRLKEIPDGDGNLLDNSMVLYGSSLGDGHEHSQNDLPTLLAGGGGGAFRTGRLLEHSKRTSLSKIHLAMMQAMGVEVDHFADAGEPLSGLYS